MREQNALDSKKQGSSSRSRDVSDVSQAKGSEKIATYPEHLALTWLKLGVDP